MGGSERGRSSAIVSHRATSGGPADALAFAAWHEAEDVLVANSDFELLLLRSHAWRASMRARRLTGWAMRGSLGRGMLLPPSHRRIGPKNMRHVLMMAHSPRDLPLIESLREVRSEATTFSMWIPEIWPTMMNVPLLAYEAVSLVDNLFVGIEDVVEQCRELAPNADVEVVPPATDVVRFAPDSESQKRPIAVLGIGRRDPTQHGELLEWSRKTHALYLYDTLEQKTSNWREHRMALANLYQNSSVSICNYAKHDLPETTGGLRVPAIRLYEGMAAGTVLLGEGPDEHRQREIVGEIVVDPLPTDPDELSGIVDGSSDRRSVEAIRRRNMALACAGHDWGHRWSSILMKLDVPLPERLEMRLESLRRRAELLSAGSAPPGEGPENDSCFAE